MSEHHPLPHPEPSPALEDIYTFDPAGEFSMALVPSQQPPAAAFEPVSGALGSVAHP